MLNILILTLSTIAIVGAAAYATLSLHDSSLSITRAQQNAARMSEVASALSASLRDAGSNGTMRAPMGVDGPAGYAYTTVPSWVTPTAMTPWGIPYSYCPYADNSSGTLATDVTRADGSTYNVEVVNNTATSGHDYVTSSDAPPAGMPTGTVGLLISPAPNATMPPSCDDVVVGPNNVPIVTGGSVTAITVGTDSPEAEANNASGVVNIYVATIATGDGTGRNTDNRTTFANAMSIWWNGHPRVTNIYMAAGAYTATTEFVALISAITSLTRDDVTLNLIGAGSGTTSLGGAAPFTAWARKTRIEGLTVSMTGGFGVSGNREVTLTASSIMNPTISSGARMIIEGPTTFTSAGTTSNAVVISGGGRLIVNNSLTVTAAAGDLFVVNMASGNMEVYNSLTLNTQSASVVSMNGASSFIADTAAIIFHEANGGIASFNGILARDGSVIKTYAGSITLNGAPIISGINATGNSEIVMNGTSLAVSSASPAGASIMVSSGSRLTLNGAVIGSAGGSPGFGVINSGASMIAGTGSIIRATTCWTTVGSGVFFDTLPNPPVTTSSSAVQGTAGKEWTTVVNRSAWTCNTT